MHSTKHDYIPRTDADFDLWQSRFLSALEERRAALGLTEEEWNALVSEGEGWGNAYAEHVRAQAAAATASRAKTETRAGYTRSMRALVQRVQTHPSMTDPDRAALGITVRQTTRTQPAAPSTCPFAQVDTSQRLRHTIHFRSEVASGSRAKPDGVRACEIWGKVSDTPVIDPSEMTFLAYATATPYVLEYGWADAGRTAYYTLRWVNTRGDRGPWSQTVSATVPA